MLLSLVNLGLHGLDLRGIQPFRQCGRWKLSDAAGLYVRFARGGWADLRSGDDWQPVLVC